MTRDTLSDLLRSVRLRGAAFYYVSFRGQWSAGAAAAKEIAHVVMPGCDHVMEFHMFAKGHGWAAVDGSPPVRLQAGDVVLFPQGDRHVISSAPGLTPVERRPEVLLTRGGERPVPISFHEGIVDAGPMPIESADAVVVCGFLGCDSRPFNPLITALPRILHLPASRAGGFIAHAIDQAVLESNERRPGGDAVLERLSEMMFVDAARRYLENLPEDSVGWLAGLRERHVGRALGLMHDRPAHPWSIDDLAREVGLSRSALHERFVRYVGQAPMQYLASWRIQLGARLLRESSRIVADIALEVGYDSEAAFARAFKRMVGMPPAAWRRAQVGQLTLRRG
jgi:AraC-like DNA-binding protein